MCGGGGDGVLEKQAWSRQMENYGEIGGTLRCPQFFFAQFWILNIFFSHDT